MKPETKAAGVPKSEKRRPRRQAASKFIARSRMKGFVQLLIALNVLTLMEPLVAHHRALSVIAVLVLLDGIYVTVPRDLSVRFRTWLLALTGALALTFVASLVTAGTTADKAAMLVSVVVQAAIIGICLVTTLVHVIREREVTLDLIAAAVVGYFFVAYLFSGIYRFIALVNPVAFQWQAWNAGVSGIDLRGQLLYFSFITLASVGYGDITPRGDFTQMLAVIEAITGQFYLAILIARLVSMYREAPAKT